jgi:rod shape-determining protein MreD
VKSALGGIVGIAAALSLQVGLSRWAPGVSERLDLLLIVVVYSGLGGAQIGAMLMGAASGLVQDVWFGALLGSNGFRKVLAGYLVASAGTRVALESGPAHLITLLLAGMADHLTGVLLKQMMGQPTGGLFPRLVLERTVCTALLGTAVYALLGRFAAGRERKYSPHTRRTLGFLRKTR